MSFCAAFVASICSALTAMRKVVRSASLNVSCSSARMLSSCASPSCPVCPAVKLNTKYKFSATIKISVAVIAAIVIKSRREPNFRTCQSSLSFDMSCCLRKIFRG